MANLCRLDRDGPYKKEKSDLARSERDSQANVGGRVFQAEGTAGAKSLRQEHVCFLEDQQGDQHGWSKRGGREGSRR